MKTLNPAACWAALALTAILLTNNSLNAQTGAASPLGKPNFSACLAEVPMPPATTAEAARRAFGANLRNPDHQALDNFYRPSTERTERLLSEYETYYRNRSNGHYANQSEATMRAQAAAQADQNPILASMGGTEQVMQMSPEQAEAAARQAAAEFTADPFAANGIQSDGMTALYQKIVSDPAYAERFQKMSEKEREAELRKFMANDKPAAKTPAQMAQQNQQLQQQRQQSDKVRAAMAFQQQIAAFNQQIQEAQMQFGEGQAEARSAAGNHQAIEADFQVKYAAIPEVVLGEGREKDPEKEQKLRRETAARHKAFAEKVLKQDLALLVELQAAGQRIAAEYVDFFKAHRHEINGNLADQLNGTETESMLAGFEMSLLGLSLDLAAKAKEATREAAGWHPLE